MNVQTISSRKIRVMIVDDSAVIRAILDKMLKDDDNIVVCGYAGDGVQAVKNISLCKPDIILLDIEMPVMDGLTAIPHLLKEKPDVKILMCSTLSERGADTSIKALSLGAADCILKPSGATAIKENGDFHTNLLRIVSTIGQSNIKKTTAPTTVTLREGIISQPPSVVAIGSSTGGPNALATVLSGLKNLPVPIVITQHMPKTFTRILAAHLAQTTGVNCIEAEEGTILQPECAYIAPGGFHMVFRRDTQGIKVHLDDGPTENFCKPAVDPMLRSLVNIYGDKILDVILTGMGDDGLEASRQVVSSGGQVIAQDAETSVVWGMPRAVANAGLCSAVLPLDEIASYIVRKCVPNNTTKSLFTGEK